MRETPQVTPRRSEPKPEREPAPKAIHEAAKLRAGGACGLLEG